jgi:hypothetical protein
MLVLDAKLAQSGGAHFLSHVDQDLGVEAEAPALGDDRRERGDVDAVLSLVVGRAAAVDARALDAQPQPSIPMCQRIELPEEPSSRPSTIGAVEGIA